MPPPTIFWSPNVNIIDAKYLSSLCLWTNPEVKFPTAEKPVKATWTEKQEATSFFSKEEMEYTRKQKKWYYILVSLFVSCSNSNKLICIECNTIDPTHPVDNFQSPTKNIKISIPNWLIHQKFFFDKSVLH